MSTNSQVPRSGRRPAASVDSAQLGPALEFMRRLWRLNHALELVSSHMKSRLGISAQQRMLIRCIGRLPGIAPSELATLLHLDRSTISITLSRMNRDGLLIRRKDKSDRRSIGIWLTARGKRLDASSSETVEGAVERMLATALRRDIEATTRGMEFLSILLEAICSDKESDDGHLGLNHDPAATLMLDQLAPRRPPQRVGRAMIGAPDSQR